MVVGFSGTEDAFVGGLWVALWDDWIGLGWMDLWVDWIHGLTGCVCLLVLLAGRIYGLTGCMG